MSSNSSDKQISGSRSFRLKDNVGRILGVVAAAFMAAGVFTPVVSTTMSRGKTDTATWELFYKSLELTFISSQTFVILASVAAIVLAVVYSKGTKIAYALYSCYAVFFGFYAILKIDDFISHSNGGQIKDGPVTYRYSVKNSMNKAYGYYLMIAGVVLVAIAAIYMLISLKGSEKTDTPA